MRTAIALVPNWVVAEVTLSAQALLFSTARRRSMIMSVDPWTKMVLAIFAVS